MDNCRHRGTVNQSEAPSGRGCGIDQGEASPEAEASHIDYLLGEIPRWKERGWIFGHLEHRLLQEYRARREAILRPDSGSVSNSFPVGPNSQSAAHRHPRNTPVAAAVPPVPGPGPSWIAEFLEAHWLKLLAALAAVFIFVGMRQVLGWEWVSTLAVRLIPVLPLGLTAGLYYFGMRARKSRTVGGFAYLAVSVGLAGFAVFAVNRYWLAEVIPPSLCLAVAAAASTVLATCTYGVTRDHGFLHLMMAGLGATLNSILRVFVPIPASGGFTVGIYSGSNLALAAVLLLAARRCTSRGDESRRVVLTWAHVSTSGGILCGSLPAVLQGTPPENAALLLFAASTLYLLAAQAFASAGMGYLSGGFGAASAVALLHDFNQLSWYPLGFTAVTLSGLALGLQYLNSDDDRLPLNRAYGELSLAYAGGSALALALRALSAGYGASPPLTGGEWPQAVLLGGLTAGAFGVLALFRRQPVLVIPSAVSSLFALTLWTDRCLAHSGLLPGHTLAHSLFPFAAIGSLSAAYLLRRYPAVQVNPLIVGAKCLATISAVAICAALIVTLSSGFHNNSHPALWISLVSYLILCAALAQILPQQGLQSWRDAAAGGAVAILVAIGGFAGSALYPEAGINASSISLGLTGWVLASLWRATPDSAAPLWRLPLSGGALVAGTLGGLFAGLGDSQSVELISVGAALNFTLLLALTACELCELSTVTATVIGALAAVRLSLVRPEFGVAFSAIAGILLAAQALRLNREPLAWLSIAAFGMAGAIGSLGDPYPWSTAGWVASAALAAGGAWSLYAAERWQGPAFAFTGAAMFLGSYARAVLSFTPYDLKWLPLEIIPLFLILYSIGIAFRRAKEGVIGRPLREFAQAASGISCIFALGIGAYADPLVAAVTLGIYGAVYFARACAAPDETWTALTAVTLTFAAGFGLAEIAPDPSQWAAGFGVVTSILLAAGILLKGRAEISVILHRLAGTAAGITALIALLSAGGAGQGPYAVAALLEAGAAFAALAVLGQGKNNAHAAFGCWFAAYTLVLYDRGGINAGMLDLYLLPLAAYLLVLSQNAVRRGDAEAAGHLWWAGLLALFAPAYVAFRANYAAGGAPFHALLLLVECIGAIAWGIAHRIRAFVLAGTAFCLAFAATLGSGAIVEVWTGLMAVAVGLSLLAFVFYVSLHQDGIRLWMQRFNQEWSRWQ